jgi:hypothetical protein
MIDGAVRGGDRVVGSLADPVAVPYVTPWVVDPEG